MGIRVDEELCDGCASEVEPACVRDCPGDLLYLRHTGKAAIVDGRACWDCAACLKSCAVQAISLHWTGRLRGRELSLKGRAHGSTTAWSIRGGDGEEKSYQTPATGSPPFAPNL